VYETDATAEHDTNGTNNDCIAPMDTPTKQLPSSASVESSPTVRHLERQQKRAVGSFIADPSKSNWKELVKSMKGTSTTKSERKKSSRSNSIQKDNVPRLNLENKLSFETEQIHPATTAHANNETKQNLPHESFEDFAIEHGIFLKAVLQLLSEKEQLMQQNVSIGQSQHKGFSEKEFDDVQDVIKIGSLKKASKRVKGVWNVKFVEIRRGECCLLFALLYHFVE
jgi:hypothetical protein